MVAGGAAAGGAAGGSAMDAGSKLPGTLWTIYMVGSDLEDDVGPKDGVSDEADGGIARGGNGSDDFREMVAGWNALTPTQRMNFDVLVAFGGARKQGWRGIKYANMPCIVQDSMDNYFGNDTCYSMRNDTAVMGSEASFRAFLNAVKAAPAREKTVVTLWDHGGGYLGIGPDQTATGDDRALLPAEMAAAFVASGVRADIVGFDACLMAATEVAVAVAPHATYMVASEEVEPDHGWDYRGIFSFLGSTPGSTALDLSRRVVDTYLDGSSFAWNETMGMAVDRPHSTTDSKTLSVVQLDRVPALVATLDAFVDTLGVGMSLDVVGPQLAFSRSAYMHEMQSDVKEWATKLSTIRPMASMQVNELLSAFNQAVVFARNDGKQPTANGLAVFSPRDLDSVAAYRQTMHVSTKWTAFVNQFYSVVNGDMAAPRLVSNMLVTNTRRMVFADNVGIDSINQIWGKDTGTQGIYDIIARMPEQSTIAVNGADTEYTIDTDGWNGKALYVCSGPCASNTAYLVYADFDHLAMSGNLIMRADIEWTDEDGTNAQLAYLYIELTSMNGVLSVVDSWVQTYAEEDGEKIIDKAQETLSAGHVIRFKFDRVNNNTDMITRQTGPTITFAADPAWEERLMGMPAERFWFVEAADGKGNRENSPEYAP